MERSTPDEKAIFNAACSLPQGKAREEYLLRACGTEPGLLARVSKLLHMHEEAPNFLEQSVVAKHLLTDNETPSMYRAGSCIGPYKLVEQIGEGGMGAVFMAEQREPLTRTVALKLVKPGLDSKQVLARFEAERQALALMNHPNIAKVLDAGTTDSGHPYFVMELVRGIPITDFCDKHRLNLKQRLQLFATVCRAVNHAHQKGIIHRDLKPSNILVELHDIKFVPKVIDFGVAKATEQNLTESTLLTGFTQILGTPSYMSPEQAQLSGLDIDTRTDIYSLGVLLYELLTGTRPYEEKGRELDFDELRRMIREDMPRKPCDQLSTMNVAELSTVAEARSVSTLELRRSLRGELEWIIAKAMEKDRNRRYNAANDFAEDIERYLVNETIEAGPPSIAYRAKKFAQKYQTIIIASVLIGFSLVAATLISLRQAFIASEARGFANEQLSVATDLLERERNARSEIESLQKEAQASAKNLSNLLYASDIRLASQAWYGGDIRAVAELLTRIQPRLVDIDIVGPEWNYLWRGTFPRHITLAGHSGRAHDVQYSPDGDLLVTGGSDGVIRFWSTKNYLSIGSLQSAHGEINDLAFAPDGTKLIAAGEDGKISIWDVASRQKLMEFEAHPDTSRKITVSAVHNTLVTCGGERTVKFWDLNTGELKRHFQPHSGSVASLDVSVDGQLLATAGYDKDHRAALWDWRTLTEQNSIEPLTRFPSLAFSPDGKWLGLGTLEHVSYFRNLQTWESPASLRHKDGVECMTFSADGRWGADGDRGGCLGIWPMNVSAKSHPWEGAPTYPRIWKAHQGRVTAVSFSPDGKQLASCGQDGAVHIWPVEECARSSLWHIENPDEWISDFTFRDDGKLVLLCNASVAIWDPLKISLKKQVAIEGPRKICMIAVPEKGDLVTGDARGGIEVRNGYTLGLISQWRDREIGEVLQIAFVRHANAILVRAFHKTVALSYPDLKPLDGFPSEYCNAVAVSDDGKLLSRATAPQNTVEVWNIEPMRKLASFSGYHDAILCLAFSADNQLLASGDSERMVRVWDLNSQREWRSLSGHQGSVSSLQFHPDGRTLLSQSREYGVVKFWNVETGRQLASLGELNLNRLSSRKLLLSPESNLIAYRHAQAIINILDVAPIEDPANNVAEPD